MKELGEMILNGTGYVPFLFAGLLYWVLKTNDEREKRYIDVVDTRLTTVEGKVDKQDIKLDKILEKVGE